MTFRLWFPFLIANEIVDDWKCSKQRGFIIKLNIEKAFDKINWNFLLMVLRLKGFNNIWIDWIKGCISSVSYSILVNGKPHDYIKATRGIQQEGHLLPFLFMIVVDYLISLIIGTQRKNLIQDFTLSNRVKHLPSIIRGWYSSILCCREWKASKLIFYYQSLRLLWIT